MFQYLALTDGVTTCELTDLVNYALVSYAPTVAPLRDNELGGSGPYEDVLDTITFHALGETAAEAYAAADAVNRLLDQARRWWRGEVVNAVTLQAQAQGTIITSSFVAAAKGRPLGGPPSLALPAIWSETFGKYHIQNITIQFERRSLWPYTTESASAAAVANPALLSVTMPSSPTTPGPLKIDFTGFTTDASGNIFIPSGFAFVGPSVAFSFQQGESSSSGALAGGATYTTVADAGSRASAGNVGRLNHSASAVGAVSAIFWTLPADFLNARRIAIYVTYRNNGAASWSIQGQAYRTVATSVAASTTPTQAIAAAASNPTALFVGIIGSDVGFDTAGLRLALTGGSGVGTIDFDTIVFVDVSDPEVYALALNGFSTSTGLGITYASKNVQVTIDNDPNVRQVPFVHTDVLTTALQLTRGYTGDAALVASGSALVALWYATHSTFWTTQNVGGSATLNIGVTITRRLARLVPQ